MLEYLLLLLSLVRSAIRDRESLVAENLLLRHQLAVLTRPTRKRSHLRARDKLFWVLVRSLRGDWRRHLVLVRPESVIRWHRQAWRLFWRWRSRGPIGRPRVSAEVRELIVTIARDNAQWGSERIRGELLKLGIMVSKRSIQRYRRRGPAGPSSQTWRTFLANHAHHLWAADLLTVQTLAFKTLYVLVFIAHGRRELVHVNVTANPTAAWVWRQVIEATPWGRKPRHLLRDHDAVCGRTSANGPGESAPMPVRHQSVLTEFVQCRRCAPSKGECNPGQIGGPRTMRRGVPRSVSSYASAASRERSFAGPQRREESAPTL
jgi:putative transposase